MPGYARAALGAGSLLVLAACGTTAPDVAHPSHVVSLDADTVKAAVAGCQQEKDAKKQTECRNGTARELRALYDQEYLLRVRQMAADKAALKPVSMTGAVGIVATTATLAVEDDADKSNIQIGNDFIAGAIRLFTDRGSSASPAAVIAEMDEAREQVWARVALGLTTPVADYPVSTLVADMLEYDAAGTPEMAGL